ncbi:MAG TPA: papain-like cysteine protease family protein [Blastocatellia bacterium]|nr:papain-like cysteine protease family protein [Blastocatellia bacterium]
MSYMVPGMTLIPQTLEWSCWYASAQMLITWRRNKTLMCESGIVDPSEDDPSIKLCKANDGIANSQIIALARRLGLRAVPPMSPTEAAIESWLRTYGPLWVNGKKHIVVIAGIKPGEVYVYDPAPLNKGDRNWRSLAGWYVGGEGSSRDTGKNVEAVFLHCPA